MLSPELQDSRGIVASVLGDGRAGVAANLEYADHVERAALVHDNGGPVDRDDRLDVGALARAGPFAAKQEPRTTVATTRRCLFIICLHNICQHHHTISSHGACCKIVEPFRMPSWDTPAALFKPIWPIKLVLAPPTWPAVAILVAVGVVPPCPIATELTEENEPIARSTPG